MGFACWCGHGSISDKFQTELTKLKNKAKRITKLNVDSLMGCDNH